MVIVKGIREGILFHLNDNDLEMNLNALTKLVKERQEFWRGAKAVLETGNLEITSDQLLSLKDELSQYDLTLWAVLSENEKTQKSAQTLGLATRISRPERENLLEADSAYFQGEP
ncbi:MAG: hypothetical protein ACPL4H_10550, partial [Anaerolineales bacterium]